MKQLIKITEEDLHNLVKEAVKSILSEYGTPEQHGAIDARHTLAGNKTDGMLKYSMDKGGNISSYVTGYIDYLNSHPEEMAKYVSKKIHQNKKNVGDIIESTVGDVLSDTIPDTEDNVYTDSDEFKDWFYPEIKKVLTDKEYNVLMSMLNYKSMDTLKRLANEYWTSTERVRQIYHSALQKLGNSPKLKKSIMSLLNGDYDKDSMNRINNMKHDISYSPGSSDKLIYNDLMLAALNVFEYGVEWNGLEPRMHRNQFIQFFKESYVQTSEAGLLEFFRKNFNKIFYNNRTGNKILKNFDKMFAPNIKRQYKIFYEKWRELLTAKKRLR